MKRMIAAYFARRRGQLRAVKDAVAVTLNTPLTGIDVLANDRALKAVSKIIRINGTPITDGGAAVNVTNGSVTLASGLLSFTPANGYTGPIAFTYTIDDGRQVREGTVSGSVT